MYDLSNVKIPIKITKEEILKRASQEEIIRYYLGTDFVINKAFRSPLRKDNVPSFVVYSLSNGDLRFKDFNGAQGSCFDLVMILHRVTFIEALNIINRDLNLGLGNAVDLSTSSYKREYQNYKPDEIPKSKSLIQFKPQRFTQTDIDYWTSYHISAETIKKYKVYSAKYIFLNKNT